MLKVSAEGNQVDLADRFVLELGQRGKNPPHCHDASNGFQASAIIIVNKEWSHEVPNMLFVTVRFEFRPSTHRRTFM
jgi:hypothetical protein